MSEINELIFFLGAMASLIVLAVLFTWLRQDVRGLMERVSFLEGFIGASNDEAREEDS